MQFQGFLKVCGGSLEVQVRSAETQCSHTEGCGAWLRRLQNPLTICCNRTYFPWPNVLSVAGVVVPGAHQLVLTDGFFFVILDGPAPGARGHLSRTDLPVSGKEAVGWELTELN